MKKVLFATSALVAAGLAGSAATAAEWETGVSGYYFLGLGVSDNNDQDGVGMLRDGEIHFDAELVADNGLTFDARVELEAFTSGDQIDENWGRVRGAFGSFMIGGNDTQGYENQVGVIYAPGARIGYADLFGLTTAAGPDNATPGVNNDFIGIHYSTPDLYGFKAHATYMSDADSDGANDTNDPVWDNGRELWNFAADYNGDFGDWGVGASFSYTDVEGVKNEQLTYAGKISYTGFTVAGFFEDDFTGDEYGIGAQYQTGPWTIAGGYSDFNVIANDVAAGWVTYDAAPGVSFTGGVEWAEYNGNDDFGGLAYMTLRF